MMVIAEDQGVLGGLGWFHYPRSLPVVCRTADEAGSRIATHRHLLEASIIAWSPA